MRLALSNTTKLECLIREYKLLKSTRILPVEGFKETNALEATTKDPRCLARVRFGLKTCDVTELGLRGSLGLLVSRLIFVTLFYPVLFNILDVKAHYNKNGTRGGTPRLPMHRFSYQVYQENNKTETYSLSSFKFVGDCKRPSPT